MQACCYRKHTKCSRSSHPKHTGPQWLVASRHTTLPPTIGALPLGNPKALGGGVFKCCKSRATKGGQSVGNWPKARHKGHVCGGQRAKGKGPTIRVWAGHAHTQSVQHMLSKVHCNAHWWRLPTATKRSGHQGTLGGRALAGPLVPRRPIPWPRAPGPHPWPLWGPKGGPSPRPLACCLGHCIAARRRPQPKSWAHTAATHAAAHPSYTHCEVG